MRFCITKSEIVKYLDSAVSCNSAKNTNPATEGILLTVNEGSLVMLTYDLEKGIKITVPVMDWENGSVIVDALKFKAILNSMPDDVITVDVNEKNIMSISCNDAVIEIIALNSSEFPSVPDINGDINFSLTQNKLKKLIEKTLFCTSNDESRPVYMGSLFEIISKNLKVTSLNNNRLANASDTGLCNDENLNQRIVIPAKTQAVLLKILNDTDTQISVSVARKHIIFTIDNIYFIARLLNSDEFMDYTRKVPTEFSTTVTISKSSILSCIDRAGLILDEKNVRNYLKLIIIENCVQIKCDTESGKVNDSVCATVSGNELTIGFNHKHLSDIIKMCDTENIDICFTGPNGAAIIKNKFSEQDKKDSENTLNCFFLIMPVRMNG